MATRLDLKTKLESILGSTNVYFQPPPGFLMSYPCIVYNRSNIRTRSADNVPYALTNQYTITVMDPNPDSTIPDSIAKLPQCSFDRAFRTEGLNNNVFTILF